jgi:hypothetical protein
MAVIDAECRNAGIGPYLPADASPRDSRRARTDCDILNLKPWWESTDEAAGFAHSLILPATIDRPIDPYRQGMTPRQYFEAICAANARESILRIIENVDGIVDLRPRNPSITSARQHLTAFEDPATFELWQFRTGINLTTEDLYRFLEMPFRGETLRISGDRKRGPLDRNRETIDAFSGEYGFVWRGMPNQRQIENGIAGGEFIVLNVKTREILGVKRTYRFRWIGIYPSEQRVSRTGIDLGQLCPVDAERDKKRRYQDITDFLVAVLKPSIPKE